MSSAIATLMDLGWTPCEPDKWKSASGDWWEFTGGTFTNILDEIHLCATNMEWVKASNHLDGSGLENGVDMRGFHKQHSWLVRNGLHGKAVLMKAAAAGCLWPAARLRAADDRYDGLCQRCLAEGNEAEETMLHRVWQCPCNPTSGVFGATEKWCKKAEEQKDEFACFWMRGLVPKTWTEANPWPEDAPGIVGCVTWQPDIYFSDGSGGVHSKVPRLRRVGWGTVRLGQDGELGEACHGSLPGKQTVPRAELMALVILAENIEVAGKFELRVDAQYLLTSMASPSRARRGSNGDLWTRFFWAREQKPQCILRVARVWRSHITARGVAIGCAAIFDMRGNTFADEMAGRAAARVDVLPGQAGAIQAVDGMAWKVRMRIIEANLAAITDHPKNEFLPPRTQSHRKTT